MFGEGSCVRKNVHAAVPPPTTIMMLLVLGALLQKSSSGLSSVDIGSGVGAMVMDEVLLDVLSSECSVQ